MKTKSFRVLEHAAVLAFVAAIMVACANAPTAFERKFYDVETNHVPRVVLVTNVVPVTSSAAGSVEGASPEWRTNVEFVTNTEESYTFKPNTNAAALVSTASKAAGLFGPWGELVGVVLGGIIGGYGLLRSSRAAKTAAVLAQVIETGRQVLQSTPQGQAIDDEWKLWMIQHQAEQGVITDVMRLLEKAVDEPSAKAVAQKLVQVMAERAGAAPS